MLFAFFILAVLSLQDSTTPGSKLCLWNKPFPPQTDSTDFYFIFKFLSIFCLAQSCSWVELITGWVGLGWVGNGSRIFVLVVRVRDKPWYPFGKLNWLHASFEGMISISILLVLESGWWTQLECSSSCCGRVTSCSVHTSDNRQVLRR